MNEEIEGVLEYLYEECLSNKQNEILDNFLDNLQQENQLLKDKIQKVIEKLDDLENNYGCGENEFVFAKEEVLKILEQTKD